MQVKTLRQILSKYPDDATVVYRLGQRFLADIDEVSFYQLPPTSKSPSTIVILDNLEIKNTIRK